GRFVGQVRPTLKRTRAMPRSQYCDGVNRRNFIKAGALGMTGLTLSNYLRTTACANETKPSRAQAAIMIYLSGGPSHMDTFDLKPDAPAEKRGEFNPIPTNVPGIEISEHLPALANHADKFAILRGVSHTLAAHELGRHYLNTGNRPLPSLEFPSYGAVVSKELPSPTDLPAWVAAPQAPHGAGFLGVEYGPLATGATPRAGRPFSVRGISLRNTLTITDVERRQNLLGDLDNAFRDVES